MTQHLTITAPEFGLLVIFAVCIIATRIMWSRVKGESRRGH